MDTQPDKHEKIVHYPDEKFVYTWGDRIRFVSADPQINGTVIDEDGTVTLPDGSQESLPKPEYSTDEHPFDPEEWAKLCEQALESHKEQTELMQKIPPEFLEKMKRELSDRNFKKMEDLERRRD